ncbi:MAG: hypothetical protein E7582_06510 [Ruminococcaceae bacterium]|nr:hypothetical protein [Oscillospiraceae bacterium]
MSKNSLQKVIVTLVTVALLCTAMSLTTFAGKIGDLTIDDAKTYEYAAVTVTKATTADPAVITVAETYTAYEAGATLDAGLYAVRETGNTEVGTLVWVSGISEANDNGNIIHTTTNASKSSATALANGYSYCYKADVDYTTFGFEALKIYEIYSSDSSKLGKFQQGYWTVFGGNHLSGAPAYASTNTNYKFQMTKDHPLRISYRNNQTNYASYINTPEKLSTRTVTYQFENDEILPLSDFSSFTFTVGNHDTTAKTTLSGGDLQTKVLFYVLTTDNTGNFVVETREYLQDVSISPSASNVVKVEDTDIANKNGYLIAIQIFPYTIPEGVTATVTAMQNISVEFTPDCFKTAYNSAVTPTGLTVGADGKVDGLKESANYLYAPVVITKDASGTSGAEVSYGEFVTLTEDTVLPGGLFAVKTILGDLESDKVLIWSKTSGVKSIINTTTQATADGANGTSKIYQHSDSTQPFTYDHQALKVWEVYSAANTDLGRFNKGYWTAYAGSTQSSGSPAYQMKTEANRLSLLITGNASGANTQARITGRNFTYQFEDDEIIPLSDFISFTFSSGINDSTRWVLSEGGEVFTRVVFYVMDENFELEARSVYKPTTFASKTFTTTTISLSDFEDTTGYLVGIQVFPFGKLSEGATLTAGSGTNNPAISMKLFEDSYKNVYNTAETPTGLSVGADGKVDGLKDTLNYMYAPVVITKDASGTSGAEATIGDYVPLDNDTVLTGGLYVVKTVLDDLESAKVLLWSKTDGVKSIINTTTSATTDGANGTTKIHLTNTFDYEHEALKVWEVYSVDNTLLGRFNKGYWTVYASTDQASGSPAYQMRNEENRLSILITGNASGANGQGRILGRNFTYQFEDDEIIPFSEFISFTFSSGLNGTTKYALSEGGEVSARVVFYVMNENYEIETRTVYKPTIFEDNEFTTTTVTLSDFDDTTGYLVGIQVFPFGKLSDGATLSTVGSGNNPPISMKLFEDGYRNSYNSAPIPTGLLAKADGTVGGLDDTKNYKYAPAIIDEYGNITYDSEILEELTSTTVLESGKYAVITVGENGYYDSYPALVIYKVQLDAPTNLEVGDDGLVTGLDSTKTYYYAPATVNGEEFTYDTSALVELKDTTLLSSGFFAVVIKGDGIMYVDSEAVLLVASEPRETPVITVTVEGKISGLLEGIDYKYASATVDEEGNIVYNTDDLQELTSETVLTSGYYAVIAMGDGAKYLDSLPALAIVKIKLDTPEGLKAYNNGLVIGLDNTLNYKYAQATVSGDSFTYNEAELEELTSTTVLTPGESYAIVSIGDGANYVDSDACFITVDTRYVPAAVTVNNNAVITVTDYNEEYIYYYSIDEETWTKFTTSFSATKASEVYKVKYTNTDGTIESVISEVETPSVVFLGASLLLDGQIGLKITFHANFEDITSGSYPYLNLTYSSQISGASKAKGWLCFNGKAPKQNPERNATYNPVTGENYFVVYLSPKDFKTAKVSFGSYTNFTEEAGFSGKPSFAAVTVEKYIESYKTIAEANPQAFAETTDLVLALEEYCLNAENYFNDTAEALETVTPKTPTEDEKEIGVTEISSPAAKEKTGALPTGINFYGTTLILENETKVRFYFRVNKTLYPTEEDVASLFSTEFNYSKFDTGFIYLESDSIAAHELGDSVGYVLGWSDGTTDDTFVVSFSPLNYVAEIYAKETATAKEKNLVASIYNYYLEAFVYVDKHGVSGFSKKSLEEQIKQIEDKMNELLTVTDAEILNVRYYPEYDPDREGYENVHFITYDGLDYMGLKTKVAAYIGFPEGASADNPVPAMVLVHGGGGMPYAEWVKLWNDRGYAAIAYSSENEFPNKVGAAYREGLKQEEVDFALATFTRSMGAFAEEGYILPPTCPGTQPSSTTYSEVDTQWPYFTNGAAILAHNILRNDERVDNSKIGITGLSWGGTVVSQVIGYDTRYAFAIPVYGHAFLGEADDVNNFAKYENDYIKALWAAENRLTNFKNPILWFANNNDGNFTLNQYTWSYNYTKSLNSKTRLTMLSTSKESDSFGHSHNAVFDNNHSFWFADWVVSGKTPLPGFITQPTGNTVNCEITIPEGVDTATLGSILYYSDTAYTSSTCSSNSMPWVEDKTALTITLDENDTTKATVTGTVPETAKCYYIYLAYTVDETQVTNPTKTRNGTTSIFVDLTK